MSSKIFGGFIKVIESFKKTIKSTPAVSDEILNIPVPKLLHDISEPGRAEKSKSLNPIPSKMDFTAILDEKKIEETAQLIESIDQKFDEFDKLIQNAISDFFIQFDPKKYPEVTEAVLFFTDLQIDNYIDRNTYEKAKSDYGHTISSNLSRYSDVLQGQNVSSIQQQINQKKKFNVIKAAFKAILGELENWFYDLAVVKKVMSYFGIKKGKSKYGGTNIGGVVMPLTQTRTDSVSLDDVDTLGKYAIILLDYVYGVISGREEAVKSNFGSYKDAILFDMSVYNSRMIFNSFTDMVSGIIDRDSIRQIGGKSLFHSDALSKAIREVDRESGNLDLLIQGDYLQVLDRSLARLIQVLRGWYFDPETYCCLVNAFGGIAVTVPKWLKTIRFALEVSIISCDLDLEINSEKINNLLGLIISSAMGTAINALDNYLNGWLNTKEANIMQSILSNKSKLIRCVPLDTLTNEFSNILNEFRIELRQLLLDLGNKLNLSSGQWDIILNAYERKKRLSNIWFILDKFIKTWEAGYICSNTNLQPTETLEPKYSPPSTLEGFPFDNIKNGEFVEDKPAVTKADMKYFIEQVLKLSPETVQQILVKYENADIPSECSQGWSKTDLAELRDKVAELNKMSKK